MHHMSRIFIVHLSLSIRKKICDVCHALWYEHVPANFTSIQTEKNNQQIWYFCQRHRQHVF
jgi:RNase P subunit RPR2